MSMPTVWVEREKSESETWEDNHNENYNLDKGKMVRLKKDNDELRGVVDF